MATGGVVASGAGVETPPPAPRHTDRPTGLPCGVPKIVLNTTSRDKICLLPPDHRVRRSNGGGGPVCAAVCGSCSLPNLTSDPEVVLTRPCPPCVNTKGRGGGGSVGGACAQEEGVRRHQTRRASGPPTGSCKLSVYCSPRVSRRGFADDALGGSGCHAATGSGSGAGVLSENHQRLGEYSWLHNADVAKFIRSELCRRESNSSVESDSSLRSASHVSTCATSEYTRFTSCDRLSLPVHDLSPSFPSPPGRLRRIFSNPEAPFLKETPLLTGGDALMRDSKSCSDLKDQTSLVNHSALERKLTTDGPQLLSPPPLLHNRILQGIAKEEDGGGGGGGGGGRSKLPEGRSHTTSVPVIGSPPPVDGWEERVAGSSVPVLKDAGGTVSRDLMIRQWLQGVDPAIVVSQDYGGNPGAGAFATS